MVETPSPIRYCPLCSFTLKQHTRSRHYLWCNHCHKLFCSFGSRIELHGNPSNCSILSTSPFNFNDYRHLLIANAMQILEEYGNSTMPTYMLLERLAHTGNWIIRCVERDYQFHIPDHDLRTPDEDDSFI